jgi:hypothetical protein
MTIRITTKANTDASVKETQPPSYIVIDMESVATDDRIPSKSSKASDSLISSGNRRQQVLTNLQSMLRDQASNDQPDQLPILTKDKFVQLFLKDVSLSMTLSMICLVFHHTGLSS